METKKDDKKTSENDSLGIEVKRSPWFLFGILQIPILIGMVVLIYFMSKHVGK